MFRSQLTTSTSLSSRKRQRCATVRILLQIATHSLLLPYAHIAVDGSGVSPAGSPALDLKHLNDDGAEQAFLKAKQCDGPLFESGKLSSKCLKRLCKRRQTFKTGSEGTGRSKSETLLDVTVSYPVSKDHSTWPVSRPSTTKRQGEGIGNGWKVIRFVRKGAFGTCYLVERHGGPVAVAKLGRSKRAALRLEYEVSRTLKHEKGFPKPKAYFRNSDGCEVLVMERLGPTLGDIHQRHKCRFPLDLTSLIGLHLLKRLETLHRHNFVHLDLHPGNICFGTQANHKQLYLIDFGTCRLYRDPQTLALRSVEESWDAVGNLMHFGIWYHGGHAVPGPRDDLEALGTLLVYLHKGKKGIPWAKYVMCSSTTLTEFHRRIIHEAVQTPPEVLCRGLPVEFLEYFRYVRALASTTPPNYNYLRKLLYSCYKNNLHEDRTTRLRVSRPSVASCQRDSFRQK